MSTASKRRRTSPTTYVTIDESNGGTATKPKPSARSSYLSPTKASIARSNPDLLPKIAGARTRRESSPNRRQSLRDAVLDNRKEDVEIPAVARADDVQDVGSAKHPTNNLDLQQVTETPGTDPVANHVREGNHITTYLTAPRSPLRIRQSSVYTPTQYRSIPKTKTPRIVPTLVHSTSRSEGSNQVNQDVEEQLPPTPVELGNDQRPYRPRGLASSSPGGEGRRRARNRDGNITSSPLKMRISPPKPSDNHDHVEVASGLGTEEDEEELNGMDDDDNDETVIVSQRRTARSFDRRAERVVENFEPEHALPEHAELRALHDQLQALEADCSHLDSLDTTVAKFNAKNMDWSAFDSSLEVLISSQPKPTDLVHLSSDTHPLFQQSSIKFLTLFSPGNLVMSYETWEKRVKGVGKFVYETTFAAPQPWPPSALNVTFESTFDLENGDIEHIRFKRIGDTPLSKTLEDWIHTQLENPITRCDLAMIVTGVGRYFDADVARARVFQDLNERYPSTDQIAVAEETRSTQSTTHQSANTYEESLDLLPFLTKAQATFSDDADAPRHKTRRSTSSLPTKEIMLVYDIGLDWISRPSSHFDIVTSGFTNETSLHAKKMFDEIQPIKGIVPAFESVCEILGINRIVQKHDQAEGTAAKASTRGRHKKSTARRMTEFN